MRRHRLHAHALALTCLFTTGIWALGAEAETRLALVIGNSAYQSVSALPNPANDAREVAEFLTTAGFEVGVAADLTQGAMRQAIGDFAAKVAGKGADTVALVFYAGHGLQVDGENFLVPVDARISRESDVALQTLRLADLMNALAAVPSKTRIVMLDACRNNPFSEINKVTGHGLAIVDAPAGSIVAYSTSPGAEAEDGTGRNSPFTTALLNAAKEPGVPIEQAMKRVRLAVHHATDGRQTPWESTSLTADFAFFPGATQVSAPSSAAGGTASGVAAGALTAGAARGASTKTVEVWRRELTRMPPATAYDLVIAEDSVEAYSAFLALYGVPPFGPRVRSLLDRRKEMVAWYVAVTLNTVASYSAFLAQFPTSDLAATAQRLIDRARSRSLNGAAFAALGGPPPGTPTPVNATPAATCQCTPANPVKPIIEKRAKAAPPPRRSTPRPRGPTDDDVAAGRAVPAGPRPGPGIDPAVATGIAIGIGSAIGGVRQPRREHQPHHPPQRQPSPQPLHTPQRQPSPQPLNTPQRQPSPQPGLHLR